ncbi:MAG: SCP2 sterol-binding domain-containing protein [Deltaproteobacteria bacterium]|nr:SCP2 sterol-binding domain-containing protein [Deltaproteobacteria bacterium]
MAEVTRSAALASNPSMPTVKEVLATLPDRVDPEAVRGLNVVVQLELRGEGDDGGNYHLVIRDGRIEVMRGLHVKPSMSMKLTGRDWVALASGGLTQQLAFLERRLSLTGDVGLASRLQRMIGLGA